MIIQTPNGIRNFGRLSYGSEAERLLYVFPPTYTLSFNSKPVLSDNGVSTKYIRNELTVVWVVPWDILTSWTYYEPGKPEITDLGQNPLVQPDEVTVSPITLDTTIQRIRAILMKPRLTLRCEYQGLGPAGSNENGAAIEITKAEDDAPLSNYYGFTIGSKNDMNFGPMPVDLKWRNLAAQQAVELSWVVAFHTPSQIIFNNRNKINKNITLFTELSWSRSYDIDELGSTTITTTGRFAISSGVIWHIDHLRVVAAFPVPLYCHRVSQKFQNDPTGKSASFTLVDKQHLTENALPPKCIKMDLTHEVSSSLLGGKFEGTGFFRWNNIIQGSITLPPGEPFITAYFMFWFYARQRLMRVQKNGVAEQTAKGKQEKPGPTGEPEDSDLSVRNLITKISFKEALFGRTHNFRLEYLGTYDRNKFIQQSGLFTPLYNYKLSASGDHLPWYSSDPLKNNVEPWSKFFTRPTTPVPVTDDTSLFSQWIDYHTQFDPNDPKHPNFNSLPLSPWNVYGYVGFTEGAGPYVFYPEDQATNSVHINEANHRRDLGSWVSVADVANNDESQAFRENDYKPIGSDQSFPLLHALEPNKTYIAHENNFSIVEDVNTFQVLRQSYDEQIRKSMTMFNGENKATKFDKAVALHQMPDTGAIPSASDYVSSYNSQPNTILIMSGYAIRVGYPPSIPSAFHYKNTSLVRCGRSIVSVRQIASGKVPVYLATWSIPYYANTSVHTNFFRDLESTAFSGVLS